MKSGYTAVFLERLQLQQTWSGYQDIKHAWCLDAGRAEFSDYGAVFGELFSSSCDQGDGEGHRAWRPRDVPRSGAGAMDSDVVRDEQSIIWKEWVI